VADTTAASSLTVAALVVSGGIGVTKASMFGGSLIIVGATTIVDTTAAGDKLTGALIVGGGLGVNDDSYFGGIVNVAATSRNC
jgi:hypothetical protein